jgi:hypothetical protein
MNPDTRNLFLELCDRFLRVESWGFLTSHARALLCIAADPGVRLRDVAGSLGITERTAHGIIADLAAAGYIVKHKHGRRNRYQIQAHLPLPDPATSEPAIGDVLAMLVDDRTSHHPRQPHAGAIRARAELSIAQRDLVGLGDVVGLNRAQSLAEPLASLPQELERVCGGALRSGALRLCPVLLDQVRLKGCSDLIGCLQRLIDGAIPCGVLYHADSISCA